MPPPLMASSCIIDTLISWNSATTSASSARKPLINTKLGSGLCEERDSDNQQSSRDNLDTQGVPPLIHTIVDRVRDGDTGNDLELPRSHHHTSDILGDSFSNIGRHNSGSTTSAKTSNDSSFVNKTKATSTSNLHNGTDKKGHGRSNH